MSLTTMYPGKVNSPAAQLNGDITAVQTTIVLTDAGVLPDAPNLAVIGTGEDAETILYTGKSGNILTGVTRGFQGTAAAWGSGTAVARQFTAYDYDTLRSNLSTHDAIDTGVHGVGAGAVVGTALAQTLTNKTLTAPVINGVVTTTGLTLPAFTLGGAVAGGGQNISNLGTLNTHTIPGSTGTLALTADITTHAAVTTGIHGLDAKAPLASPSFSGTVNISGLTASEILGTDGSKNLVSLAVATYPSLTELSYVKGVTSALQTQLGLKAALASPAFTGTVTLPAVTLAGAVAGGGQNISNIANLSIGTTSTTYPFYMSASANGMRYLVNENTSAGTSAGAGVLVSNDGGFSNNYAQLTVYSSTYGDVAYTNFATLSSLKSLKIFANDVAEVLYLIGGSPSTTSGAGAYIRLTGKNHASTGAMFFETPNAAGSAYLERLNISGKLATAVAAWSNVTHTGIVLSGNLRFNAESTGAGATALGSNCPAAAPTAIHTWLTVTAPDGDTVYIPAWK